MTYATADISPDPDIAQAIDDLRATALEIRDRSKGLLALKAGKPAWVAATQYVADLVSGITVRADRLGLTTDELLALINADIALGGRVATPRTAAALSEAVDAAVEREKRAHRALTVAQTEVRAATAARLVAERAATDHAAGCLT
jgi:hypothetical protein